jgi:regulation of enolase protein 1 (concanavalin A-like superfamily)
MANQTAVGPVWSFTTAGTPPPGSGNLPTGWSSADIGAVAAAGKANFDGSTNRLVVSGSGADVWGTADEFRYTFTTLTGDGVIVARLLSLSSENAWTKAGVMMRDGLSAGSRQASMFVSAAKGTAFQRRVTSNGVSTSTSGPAGAAPYWVQMGRSGSTFTASVSTDGVNWVTVGTETIAMGSTIQVGLAITSHLDGAVSTATIDNITVGGSAPPPPPPGPTLPEGWSADDIGAVAAGGTASYDSGAARFTVTGSGADIWGTADEFRYAFTDLSGDGSITARVATLGNENAWTKAGVMMRDGLTAWGAHASMLVSAGKGLAFQRRTASGGLSTSTAGGSGTAPSWVRVSRSGSTFSAFTSVDGTNWVLIGTDTISMGSTIKVGLAISSHVDGTLSTATFDSVTVGAGEPPPPAPPPPSLPAGWSATDIGATTPAGSASFDAGTATFTVRGAGADVWGAADALQYAYTTLDGDGEIVARVASLQNVDVWTKAGVMMRDGLTAGAAHATMFLSPTTLKGSAYQRRPTENGSTLSTAGPSVKPPYWLKVTRLGTTFTGYTSLDGVGWTPVASETIVTNNVIDVGLAVVSHQNGTLATAAFTDVTVTKY